MDGTALKTWRKARELTQDQLAELLAVSRSTIIRWEHNEQRPAGNLLERACKQLEQESHDRD